MVDGYVVLGLGTQRDPLIIIILGRGFVYTKYRGRAAYGHLNDFPHLVS